MNAEQWAETRRLKLIENLSISEIGRRLGLDRRTVRRAVTSETVPDRTPCPVKPSKLEPYKSYIQDRLREYPGLAATRLYAEIMQQGYAGKMRIVWEYIAGLRTRQREVFLRIETQPGECAQVDWAHCGTVQIGTAQRKLSCFVMVLSYSRMMYLLFAAAHNRYYVTPSLM